MAQPSSGTYAFQPSVGELGLYAFSLLEIRRTAIVAEHMTDLRMAVNTMLAEWSVTAQPNLWKVGLATQTLSAGQATYSVDPAIVMILDAYIETGDDPPIDRMIYPMSRTEYANQPNKTTPGFPTLFWYDRTLEPTITLWQPPDDSQPYTLKYYYVNQIEDASVASGQTPDIPYRWLNAFAFGLAAQLSYSYAPAKTQLIEAKAQRAFNVAATQDVENVPLSVIPSLSGYYEN